MDAMNQYEIDLGGLTVNCVSPSGEASDMNAMGGPCSTRADLRELVHELHDQEAYDVDTLDRLLSEIPEDPYYVVHHAWTQGGDEGIRKDIKEGRIYIQTAPARGNQSGEPITEGWCGTTSDWGTYAHGEYATLEDARAKVREVAGEEGWHECAAQDRPDPGGLDAWGPEIVEAYREGWECWDAGAWLDGVRQEYIDGTQGDDEPSLADEDVKERMEASAAGDHIILVGLERWIEDAREEVEDEDIPSLTRADVLALMHRMPYGTRLVIPSSEEGQAIMDCSFVAELEILVDEDHEGEYLRVWNWGFGCEAEAFWIETPSDE